MKEDREYLVSEYNWGVKMGCQIMKICYNMGVATFWQQKISKPE